MKPDYNPGAVKELTPVKTYVCGVCKSEFESKTFNIQFLLVHVQSCGGGNPQTATFDCE